MTELVAVAIFTLLAVISPGADFAMVTRSSYAQGRKAGLAAAVGIALGVQVHVLYTVLGIAVIISQSPMLFLAMKVVGAGYLIYLGYKSVTNTRRISLEGGAPNSASVLQALRTGFLTNALNPKTMLFVVCLHPGRATGQLVAAGICLWCVHVVRALAVVQPGRGVFFQHCLAQGHDRPPSAGGPRDRPGADRARVDRGSERHALTPKGQEGVAAPGLLSMRQFSQAKKKGLPCGKPFVLFGGYTGT